MKINIHTVLQYIVLVVFSGVCITSANADPGKIKDGLEIKTEEGRFEMAIGGRVHLDAHLFSKDNIDSAFPAFGSQLPTIEDRSGFNLRRTYLTLSGKFYGLKYKLENDFSAGTYPDSTREMWVSTTLGRGDLVIGQFKPYRGMEELTSSNEITMMERPSTSSTGIFNARQFLMGVGYKGIIANQFGYAADVMKLAHVGLPLKGLTYGGRVFWVPISEEGNTLHLGLSYSVDNPAAGSIPANPVAIYGGRRGIRKSFGTAGMGMGLSYENSETIFAVETAYAIGPVTLQAEYATVKLDNTHLVAGAQQGSDLQAYYLQAGWFVTGEKTVYQKDRGAFSKPKKIGKWGAVEVAARYNFVENKDQSLTANPCATGTSECQVQSITLGVNWYVKPNARVMLNYYLAEADIGNTGIGTPDRTDSPSVISFRTQYSF